MSSELIHREDVQQKPVQLKYYPKIRKIAIILVNFINDPSEPFKLEEINDVMSITNKFYLETSYNNLGISYDIYGWYTLNSFKTCEPDVQEVIDTADSEIYYPNYDGVILYYPANRQECGFDGMATLGNLGLSTNDGLVNLSFVWIIRNADWVTTHEIGHNLKANHANLLNCGEDSFPVNEPCKSIEYGDKYDAMGTSNGGGMGREPYHFNAYHKDLFKWLNSQEAITVTNSGVYQISPIEEMTSNLPKTIKIPRENDTYYIEYRQPIGFDRNLNGEVISGALLHMSKPTLSDGSGVGYSYLIDTYPPINTNPEFFVIKPGETYYDNILGLSINTISANAQNLLLNISFFPSSCQHSNPTITINPNSYAGNNPFRYNISIKNNDNLCFPRKFSIDSVGFGKGFYNIISNTIRINYKNDLYPNELKEGFIIVMPDYINLPPVGEYTFYIDYKDDIGYNLSTPFYYNFNSITCEDGTPFNQCSINKPLYCDYGNLINACSVCSCNSRLSCQLNGKCSKIRIEQ